MTCHLVSPPELIRALLQERVPFSRPTGGRANLPEKWNGARHFIRRAPEDHMLWGVIEGTLRVHERNRTTCLPPGSAMWIHGGNTAWFSMAERCTEVLVYHARFGIGGDRPLSLRQTLHVSPGRAESVAGLVDLIQHLRPDPNPTLLQIRARLADLLIGLLGEVFESESTAATRGGLNRQQQQQCLGFLRDNIRRFFSLAEVAEHCRLNPAYLSARFRKTFGHSLQHQIKITRIQEARELLLETPLSISAIAEQLGYRDVYYFSRQFKDIMGVSPRTWRESL